MENEDPATAQYSNQSDASPIRKRKKRIRTWTASDRQKHRIFEKGRREAFNERLMDLAQLLPALANAKESQLSKHVIVDESVKRLQAQSDLIESLRNDMSRVLTQHQQLLDEFNAFREALNFNSASTDVAATVAPTTSLSGSGGSDGMNVMALQHIAIPDLQHDNMVPNDGDAPMLRTGNSELDHGTQLDAFEVRSSTHSNPITSMDVGMDAPIVFNTGPGFDPSLAVNASRMQSSEFQPTVQMAPQPSIPYFGASTVPVYIGNNWNRNSHLSTFEIFNISYDGGSHQLHSSNV